MQDQGIKLLQAIGCNADEVTATQSGNALHGYKVDSNDDLSVRSEIRRFENATPASLHADYDSNGTAALNPASRILLRDGEQCHWIRLQEIIYLESCANHTLVFCGSKKIFVHNAIGKIEARLPQIFFRVSRQHIVNVEFVTSVEPWINGGYRLRLSTAAYVEVSRRHAKRFKESFSL